MENGLTNVQWVDAKEYDPANLQMIMVTTSMNHEYTRKAYEKTKGFEKREELMSRMSNLKSLYFTAREQLANLSPDKLVEIEGELQFQKQTVLSDSQYH